MAINRVNISGNLTRDAELRCTAGGTQVLAFGVAVNDRRRNPQTGEWEDYPNFVDCTMFGNRAEAIARYLANSHQPVLFVHASPFLSVAPAYSLLVIQF